MRQERIRSGRRSIDLAGYRGAMGRSGDISVGAYARAERWRHIWISLTGLALVATAGGIFLLLRSTPATRLRNSEAVLTQCVDCGLVQEGLPNRDGSADAFFCEKCQKHSARKLWACRSCETVFVPTNKDRQDESSVSCPQCGSRQVGIAEKGARPLRSDAGPAGEERPESPHASAVPGRAPD